MPRTSTSQPRNASGTTRRTRPPAPRSRQAFTGAGPACPTCAEELVEIELVIDGAPLTMRSCGTCDRRSWHRGDESVELGGVLADLSSVPTRYRRDLAGR